MTKHNWIYVLSESTGILLVSFYDDQIYYLKLVSCFASIFRILRVNNSCKLVHYKTNCVSVIWHFIQFTYCLYILILIQKYSKGLCLLHSGVNRRDWSLVDLYPNFWVDLIRQKFRQQNIHVFIDNQCFHVIVMCSYIKYKFLLIRSTYNLEWISSEINLQICGVNILTT